MTATRLIGVQTQIRLWATFLSPLLMEHLIVRTIVNVREFVAEHHRNVMVKEPIFTSPPPPKSSEYSKLIVMTGAIPTSEILPYRAMVDKADASFRAGLDVFEVWVGKETATVARRETGIDVRFFEIPGDGLCRR